TKSEVCQEKKLHLYADLVFPISLYLFPHIPVPFPYFWTFRPISLYSSPYPCTLRSICSIKMLLYQLLIAILPFPPYPCTFSPISLYLSHIPVPFPYFWTFRPISLDFSPHIPRPIGN